MSYSSLPFRGRAAGLLLLTSICVGLAGCQARPMYAESTGIVAKMSSISYAPAGDRITQQVRNNLVFLTGGGAGEPADAAYEVRLNASSSMTNILDEQSYTGPIPGRVTVTADYALVRKSDGQVLRVAKRRVTAAIDLPSQEFAKIRAIRDAENRASREVAEFIRSDIASVPGL